MQNTSTAYSQDRLAHFELMVSTNWPAESIAEFLIPETSENPLDNWREYAQQYLITLIEVLKEKNELSLERFKYYLFSATQEELTAFLSNTPLSRTPEFDIFFNQIRFLVACGVLGKSQTSAPAAIPKSISDLSRDARAACFAALNGAVPDVARDDPRLNPKMLRRTQDQLNSAKAFVKNKQYFSIATYPVMHPEKMVLPGVAFQRGGEVFPDGTDTSSYNPGVNFCYPETHDLAQKLARYLAFNEYSRSTDTAYCWVHRLNGVAYVSAYWHTTDARHSTPRQCCLHFAPGTASDFSALDKIMNDPLQGDFECTVRTIDHLDAFEFIRLVERERNVCDSAETNYLQVF